MSQNMYLMLVVVATVIGTGYALQCYKCVDMEASTTTSFTDKPLSFKTDAGCESLNSVPDVTCPVDGNYKCGFMRGDITTEGLGGSVDVKTRVRGCFPVEEGTANGCTRNSDMTKRVKDMLPPTMVASVSSMNFDICFCDTDLCDPGCGNFSFMVNSVCISWWVIIGAAGGLVLLITLCCICCCCCCCRSRPARFVPVQNPNALVVTSLPAAPAQMHGMSPVRNAGYDQPTVTAGTVPVYAYNQPGDKC